MVARCNRAGDASSTPGHELTWGFGVCADEPATPLATTGRALPSAGELQRVRQRRSKPGAAAPNPNLGPSIWYGASQQAALHALGYWCRKRLPELVAWNDPGAREIGIAVSDCLAGGGVLSAERDRRLDDAAQQLRRRIGGGLYHEDASAYFRARGLLFVAKLVTDAGIPEHRHPVMVGGPQDASHQEER